MIAYIPNTRRLKGMTNFVEFKDAKVLITGGLGFIGSSLARTLVQAGAKVVIVDALLPAYGGNKFNVADIEKDIEVVDGDVRDSDLMNSLVADKNYVFHLAGQVSYLDSKDRPFDDLDFNGKGTLTILEAMREYAPKARLVFASSRIVYGKIQTLPVREDHPTDPLSLYGIHKLLGEKYLRYYHHQFGLSTVSIRIPNPYGPRQQMKHSKYSIVGWFVRQAMEDKTITVFGDGKQERDYLYIDDLTAAFLQLALGGESGEAYNVGTHERVSFGGMVDVVLKATGSGKKEYVPWPDDYEKNETGDYIADTSKLEKITGWRPTVMLEQGIGRMVEFYMENRKQYW